METRKLEILEERLLDGAVEYFAGDIKSFEKSKADRWIGLGWAKCVETGEVGERKAGANGLVEPSPVITPLA